MAARLASGVADVPGVTIRYPVASNAVFAVLSAERIAALRRAWTFYTWLKSENVVRWMTSFDTTEEDVDSFLYAIRAVGTP
jgi:threonine aldolase